MFRISVITLALAGLVFETGCTTCGSCGHHWFRRERRCDPCDNGATLPPTAVPVVPGPPPGAVVPPPPVSSGYGPTPDFVAPNAYAARRTAYINSYAGCCK
jgi:hypothetical protein